MAANRCSNCDAIMTRSELLTGKCPVCGTSVENGCAEEVSTSDPMPRKLLGFLARFGILFLAAVPGTLIAAALGVSSSSCVMVGGVPTMMMAQYYLQSKGLIAKRTKAS